jgi:hypothetical protein
VRPYPSVQGHDDDNEEEAEDGMGGKRGDIKVGRCRLESAESHVESEMFCKWWRPPCTIIF